MIDVVVVDVGVVVDPRQRPSIQPDVGLGVAGLILFVQQFAVGAVVEDSGQPVLVDFLDALAQDVVGVGGGFACGLAGRQAVEPVVGEAGRARAQGVAIGGTRTRLGTLLVQPVGRAVGLGHGAGVAGLALLVAVLVVGPGEAAVATGAAVEGGDEAAGGVVGVAERSVGDVVEVIDIPLRVDPIACS